MVQSRWWAGWSPHHAHNVPGPVMLVLLIRDRRKQLGLRVAGGHENLRGKETQEAPVSSSFSFLTGLPSARSLPTRICLFAISLQTPASFISVLPSHLFLVMAVDKPPFTGEVESKEGKRFILRTGGLVVVCSHSLCTLHSHRQALLNMGIQGEA